MRIHPVAIVLSLVSVATAARAQEAPRADLALTYQAVRTNTTPGVCGCFFINGGELSFAWSIGHGWSVTGLASEQGSSKVLSTGQSLTLTSFMGGVRYFLPQLWKEHRHDPQVFAEVLAGGVLAKGEVAGSGEGTSSFGLRVGGGIDIPIDRYIAVRLLDASYFLTDASNATNNRQNNLLVGAGISFRWPSRTPDASRTSVKSHM